MQWGLALICCALFGWDPRAVGGAALREPVATVRLATSPLIMARGCDIERGTRRVELVGVVDQERQTAARSGANRAGCGRQDTRPGCARAPCPAHPPPA